MTPIELIMSVHVRLLLLTLTPEQDRCKCHQLQTYETRTLHQGNADSEVKGTDAAEKQVQRRMPKSQRIQVTD